MKNDELSKTQRLLNVACAALALISAEKRPDGTYWRDREACEVLARETLESIEDALYTPEQREAMIVSWHQLIADLKVHREEQQQQRNALLVSCMKDSEAEFYGGRAYSK